MGGGAGGGGIVSVIYLYTANFAGEIIAFGGKGVKSGASGTIYVEQKFINSMVNITKFIYLFYFLHNLLILLSLHYYLNELI